MRFIAMFNGAQTTTSDLLEVITAIGGNTFIIVNTAQALTASDWASINQAAYDKNLTAQFNGAQTSLSLMQQFFAAAGSKTGASLNTAQTWSASNLESLASAAGSKTLSADFNAAQSTLSTVQPFFEAAGINTSATLNTAQTWSVNDLVALANIAG